MLNPKRLEIFCNIQGQRHFVGLLSCVGREIFFEYAPDFLNSGIQLSPFKLPLRPGVFEDPKRTFAGLFGLFNDSLPDGWGLLLLDRSLTSQGVPLDSISPLHRLTMVGTYGMGALEYVANEEVAEIPSSNLLSLDGLAADAQKILAEEEVPLDAVNELIRLGGTSGGARPKILADLSLDETSLYAAGKRTSDCSPWLIKFFARDESQESGLIEYVYSLMAKEAGVIMPETKLFPSDSTPGYFGVRRFDRDEKHSKIHTHTVSGLLHVDFRIASLDYENLLKLTSILTKDIREVEKMVRLMVFNVKAKNRDDHAKNFSFLLDPDNKWKMAPAYDLTPSIGLGGEHNSMVNGKGRDITDQDLMTTASLVDIPQSFVREAIQRTGEALSHFESLKEVYREVSTGSITMSLGPRPAT